MLLAEQPQLGQAPGARVKPALRVVGAALVGQALGQPEAAGHERALATGQAVADAVAADEPVLAEVGGHRVGRGDHLRIVVRDQAGMGDQERGRVHVGAIEALDEAPAVVGHAAADDGSAKGVALALPVLKPRIVLVTVLREGDRPIQRSPAAGLGVHEVQRSGPPLPQPVIGLAPASRRFVGQAADEVPVLLVELGAPLVGTPQQLDDLTQRVELQLRGRRVADAHGARAAPATEALDLQLGQPPLAGP